MAPCARFSYLSVRACFSLSFSPSGENSSPRGFSSPCALYLRTRTPLRISHGRLVLWRALLRSGAIFTWQCQRSGKAGVPRIFPIAAATVVAGHHCRPTTIVTRRCVGFHHGGRNQARVHHSSSLCLFALSLSLFRHAPTRTRSLFIVIDR